MKMEKPEISSEGLMEGREYTLKVAAAQIRPFFGKPEKNRHLLSRYCAKAGQQEIDLLVFPELCVSGYNFTSQKQVDAMAEPIPGGPTTQLWMKLAEEYNMIIIGGLAESEQSSGIYNSAAIVGPNGFIGYYRKIHLFAREKEWFLPGQQPPSVWKCPIASIGVLVCFDWAFPEVSRILMLEGCEVLCLPSNLVLPYAQRIMIARSLENRFFTVLANRIGSEGKLTFTGRSQITNTLGEILIKGSRNRTGLLSAVINPAKAQDKFLTNTNHIIKDRRVELYQRLLDK
jgi:beta-ureidopropionase